MQSFTGRLKAALLVSSSLLTATVWAHHSTAEFDYTKQLTIQGKVKEVQWTNPHSYIQLLVTDADGKQVEWSVEIGSPSLNINMGWRKDSVVAGDDVTMLLSPARNGTPYGTLRVLTFPDGRELRGVASQVGGGRRGAPAPRPQAE